MPGDLAGGRGFQTPADGQGNTGKLHAGSAQPFNIIGIYQISLMDADKRISNLRLHLVQLPVKAIFSFAGYQKDSPAVAVKVSDILKAEPENPVGILEEKLAGSISF